MSEGLAAAFGRLVEDSEFATQVATGGAAALGDYELTGEEIDALLADAAALEGDVVGFGQRLAFAQVMSIGGLRSPGLIGGGSASLSLTGPYTNVDPY